MDSKISILRSVIVSAVVFCFAALSCQREYMEGYEEKPTSSIDFQRLTSSRDSACMFDTVILHAEAYGENLKYEWQRAKGSLVPVPDDPSRAYFWGCQTCIGRLTVSCTVYNDLGAYTKEIDVFVWPWMKGESPFPGWEKYVDRYGSW